MENEGHIIRLNEYCILDLLRVMNIASILAFGCTNIRHRQIVHNFIAARQQQLGNIHFILNGPINVTREIMLRFGEHFIILDVHFGPELIDMNIFEDYNEGNMINNAQELNLRAYVNERMTFQANVDNDDDDDEPMDMNDFDFNYDGHFNNGDNVPPMLDRFRLNAEYRFRLNAEY